MLNLKIKRVIARPLGRPLGQVLNMKTWLWMLGRPSGSFGPISPKAKKTMKLRTGTQFILF